MPAFNGLASATDLTSFAPCLNSPLGVILKVPAAFLTAFAPGFSRTLFVSRKVSGPTTILSHSVFLFELKTRICTVNASSGRFSHLNVDRKSDRSSEPNKNSSSLWFIGGSALIRIDNAFQLSPFPIQKKRNGVSKLYKKIRRALLIDLFRKMSN
ncbi:hypothetical protein QE436_002938 [Pantoea anthophila]|nr:hypothetical protein [Pantoea anthophila]